jgi:predicted enzyme involved in methoxymalonyl-ACP biosynthesis
MSCRVFKRTMEDAMFAALCEEALARGVRTLIGRYVPSPKNTMVESHYERLGFTLVERTGAGSMWRFELGGLGPAATTPIRRI